MQNFVVISVDDLAHWAGPSGLIFNTVSTPNIDRLMASGVTFENAYTPEAICNAARTAAFSGLNPNTTGVHSNSQQWSDFVDPSNTWPAVFKDAGYNVAGFGKLLHPKALPTDQVNQMFTDYAGQSGFQNGPSAAAVLPASIAPETMTDYISISQAINFLDQQTASKPFMLNVGLVKPHLDWVVPQEYFDLYPIDQIVVPGLVDNDLSGVPAFIVDQLPAHGITTDNLQLAKQFLQGYLASLSYADAQLGRLLDALESNGQYTNSNIILWSDHGFHLGDRDGLFGKFTLWEESTKIPLVIKAAGNTNAGAVVDDIVNLIDIFPTLTTMAGLARPSWVEGDSLVPLVTGNGIAEGDGISITWMYGSVMMRTPTYALIHYEDGSEELYNLKLDPEQDVNLALDASYAATLATLRAQLYDKANIVDPLSGPSTGTSGIDTFYLNDAGDIAIGLAGNDVYYVNHADAQIREVSGGGRDAVFVTTDFTLPAHVENLFVNAFNDSMVKTIRGNDLANNIGGGASEITIFAGAGDDLIRASLLSSTIHGEAGNDFISGSGTGDFIYGGKGNDTVNANGGADTVIDADGANIIFAGAGTDKVGLLSGKNTISGGDDDDLIIGGYDNDVLKGNAGRDVIVGDNSRFIAGADQITGGAGDDLLEGGGGADTFVFAPNEGADTIGAITVNFLTPLNSTVVGADFVSGVDSIALNGFGFTNAAAAFLKVRDIAGVATFVDQGTSITFTGLTTADLTADDFDVF